MTRGRHDSGPSTIIAPTYKLTEGEGKGKGAAVPGGGRETDPPPRYQNRGSYQRKRKSHISSASSSAYDKSDGDDARSSRSLDNKQNHSEIEKRRRDKMNTYITELSSMIPMCGAMARKLDKLTVLRMAVQHIRSIRGALTACPLTARPKSTLLSDNEINSLILQAAQDSFLIVVGCDRGRLLYVSASAKKMLHYDQTELLGQSLFDLLHPKDVAKVKEQLSSSESGPRERLIDAKTMLPVKADLVTTATRFCPGARRSFFCRIKSRSRREPQNGVEVDSDPAAKVRKKHTPDRKYTVVHCTGYLKSWVPSSPTERSPETEVTEDGEAYSMTCLVALGRALPDLAPEGPGPVLIPDHRPLQFVSRHATDGKFLFVDQRVTLALGFLPQELIGTSLYEYVSGPELGSIARTHKAALLQRTPLQTPAYGFRKKDGNMARITTHFKTFRNPWTKEVEYLVANNTVVAEDHDSKNNATQGSFELYKCGGDGDSTPGCIISESDHEMQRLIESQVESHKIGSAIAEEALRRASPTITPDLLQEVVFNAQSIFQESSIVESIFSDAPDFSEDRSNVTVGGDAGGASSQPPLEATSPPPGSPTQLPLGLDGNGEATMAVIMSLLEADAGLGGAVNFSGLPWPLP